MKIELPTDDLTRRVIGAAMAVHTALGPGFLEKVYERAMMIELKHLGINAVSQAPVAVWYRGESAGTFAVDILAEEELVVELKTVRKLSPADVNQTTHYLKALEFHVALLFNFGARSLEFRRLLRETAAPGASA